MSISQVDPAQFGVSPTNGFLPETPPLTSLSPCFDAWEDVGHNLPKYLAGDNFRKKVESLPPFELEKLEAHEHERAMSLLSYLGHAYVWTGKSPAETLPAVLGKPWHHVASTLGRPPVLSYSSYALHNWRLLDSKRPIETGNIALIQNFYGGIDEEWFIIVHVDIEKKAAPLLTSLLKAQLAVSNEDNPGLKHELRQVTTSLIQMNESLERMLEFCDPYVYYHRVRPYIHGWKGHPDLPNGLVYEGVGAYNGEPQKFRGETGAQSAIVPALDGFFGVHHEKDLLREYLMEMRDYMPPKSREFISAVENGPRVREYVQKTNDGELIDLYNEGLAQLERFRSKHYEYAAMYIFKQGQTDAKNPHAVGTGGTPFMPYLRKHRDETHEHALS